MDEENDESSVGASKYPVMPSLLSLQQMRNRLHLSYLGRKLMKWTALATGRELRKIAMAADLLYRSFFEDVCEAYIMLARCRYFHPNMNEMVVENIGTCANVRVVGSARSITGVKVVQFDIVESGVEPYAHLGLEKGGQQIHEAKLAWLGLLKRLILMLELRTSFVLLETANRTANARMNVMNKVTIPRTKATIHYILIEMEEIAREELYRIKITKKKKARDAENVRRQKKALANVEGVKLAFTKDETSDKKIVKAPPPQKTSPILDLTPCPPCSPCPLKQVVPVRAELKNDLQLQRIPSIQLSPPREIQATYQTDSTEDSRLQYLKVLLSNVITLGKEMVHTGLNSIDIDEFLQICDEARIKINNIFMSKSNTNEQVDPVLRERLKKLKSHLREVVSITNDFKSNINVTRSVEHFIESCEEADNKLNLIMNAPKKEMVVNETSSPVCQGNLCITSAEEVFHAENKASPVPKGDQKLSNYGKLEDLTEHVCELEKMTAGFSTGTKVSGLDTNNLENLSICCKEFKDKLEAYKNKVYNSNVSKLLLTEFPGSADTVPDESYSNSENIDKFVYLCESLNKIFDEKSKGPENFEEHYMRIDKIIHLLRQFNDEGIQNPRLAEFLKGFEKNVEDEGICHEGNVCCAPIKDINESPAQKSHSTLKSYLPTCCCTEEGETSQKEISKCNINKLSSSNNAESYLPPCGYTEEGEPPFCNTEEGESPCCYTEEGESTCCYTEEGKPHCCYTKEGEPPCCYTEEFTSQKEIFGCNINKLSSSNNSKSYLPPCCFTEEGETSQKGISECNINKLSSCNNSESDDALVDPSVDKAHPLFKKTFKKIVRVTRRLNDDGRIREETETIIIKRSKHEAGNDKDDCNG